MKHGVANLRCYVLACLLAGISATWADAACVVRQSSEIALRAAPVGWVLPLVVNRTELPFLLDTGAERSMIFQDDANRIGVRRDEWVATTTRGIGGEVRLRNADPDTLSLGGLALRRHTVAADNTLVVANARMAGVGGLLGQDLLSPFDLGIDGPRSTLTLFAVSGCTARTMPWSSSATAIAAFRAVGSVMLIPVTIDGHVLQAEIDTGSTVSLVTSGGMQKLGLTDATLAADQAGAASGVGPRTLPLRRHRFASVAVGGMRSADAALWVGPAHILRSIDLLLGRDWLLSRRVWLSFSTNTVFVQNATAR